jgi:membrane dipeptidase
MNRRTFLWNTAQAGLLLKLAPASLFGQQPPSAKISPALLESYRKWLVIDALAGINAENLPIKPQVLQQALDSGVTGINWTVSMPDFEATVDSISFVEGLVEGEPSHFLIARRQSDLDHAKQTKRIAIILGFQHPQPIESDLKHITMFRRLGVRVMQLTYNNRSLFGDGCLEPANAGLSKLGRSAIARMNELGVAVDLSHCGQRTTAEAIEASSKPVLITHAGCSAVHAHPRNKDDRELRALADRGGVVGIYFMPYLVASPTLPTRQHVIEHIDHALKVCGSDHVGIGTDGVLDTFPDTAEQRKEFAADMANRKKLGIAAPEEDRPPFSPDLNTPHRMEIIAAALEKQGHSTEVIEKVMGRNFYRAFGEIWGGSTE